MHNIKLIGKALIFPIVSFCPGSSNETYSVDSILFLCILSAQLDIQRTV